jgi:BlaI family penicillinase repressor
MTRNATIHSGRPLRLTGPQLAVLRVLWDRSEATVTDVQQALHDDRPLAATTIATLLSRLERRGVVTYRTEGRQYVYRAVLSERDARQQALVDVTDGLFDGDVATLVSQLLSSRELRSGDLAKVKLLIEAKEEESRKRRRT